MRAHKPTEVVAMTEARAGTPGQGPGHGNPVDKRRVGQASFEALASVGANSRLSGVVVIIPARNEESALPMVLRALPKVDDIIVVDNGSTDRTAQVARDLTATVIYERQPGYGSACLAGLAELERRQTVGASPPQVVAFLDGDYSDYPELLPLLVEPILSDQADIVLGSRLAGEREPGAMPMQSVLGNRLACWLMRRLWRAPYSDLGPFRAIRYSSLQSLTMTDRSYGWTIEMQIKAAIAGLRIGEVPTPYRRRIGQSKISGTVSGSIKAGARILSIIFCYAILRRTRVWAGRSV